jgi:hypothetical protein
VIALIIAASAIGLYGMSLAVIYALSSSWKVCAQTQAVPPPALATDAPAVTVNPARSSAPPAAQPLQPPNSNPPASSQAGIEPAASTPQPDLVQVFAAIDQLGSAISASQKYRLKAQLIQFQQAQQQACAIGLFFFANRNATLTVCTAAAILSIASLAFVSKNGWEGTNNTFINIGITSGLVLFTTWTFSQLYGQGVNYENQKAKVILAADMLNRMASATANQSDGGIVKSNDASGAAKSLVLNLTNPKDLAVLMDALDGQLRVLTNLDFSGDSSFAEQSAKRFGDMLTNTIRTVPPTPPQGPAPK